MVELTPYSLFSREKEFSKRSWKKVPIHKWYEVFLKYDITSARTRIYNRHGVFDTNRLRFIIYTPLLAN